MPTHRFNDESDYRKGGVFIDGYGRPLAKWTWDSDKRELVVTRGMEGRRKDFSRLKSARLNDDELRKRLPDLAYHLADSIDPFDRPKAAQ